MLYPAFTISYRSTRCYYVYRVGRIVAFTIIPDELEIVKNFFNVSVALLP